MKRLWIAALILSGAAFVSKDVTAVVAAAAQASTADTLRPYSQIMANPALPLTIIIVNDKTAPVLFQPPTLYSIRARAAEKTTLYVQGVTKQNTELDTTNFTLEQGGASDPGTPTSIKNFTKGKVKLFEGDRVDGLVTFSKLFSTAQPFTVKHGKDAVQFTPVVEAAPAPGR